MQVDDAVQTTDLEYRRVDGVSLLGRLYRPAGGARVPVMIEVHGGGWTSGDRLTNVLFHRALAAAGVAVFAIDFRMPPVAAYPAALEDVAFAIRWLKANAADLDLVPTAFGGIGTSSGGHLLLTTMMRPDDHAPTDAALRAQSGGLDFAIACWPVADPLARYRMATAKGISNLVEAHHAFWPDEAAMAKANPQLILDRGEAGKLPPLLFVQGTADENVEHERADMFADSYRARGGVIELRKYPGAPHMFITRDPQSEMGRDGLATVIAFVKQQAGLT